MIVYTQPACMPCKRVIDKLHAAGINFDLIDISEDQDAWNYLVNVLEAKSTPVIVDDEYGSIIGYQPEKLKELISWYESPKLAPCQRYGEE